MVPVDHDESAAVASASWTSPWHAMAPAFLIVKWNSRSPVGCWRYQLRVTSSWQVSVAVDPVGEIPTRCEAVSGLALFQVQLCDAPALIPPVDQVLDLCWDASRSSAPKVIAPVFLISKWNSRS